MPAQNNQDESAWFYHSTFERSKSEKPTPKPLMSQIPGINGCQDDKAAGTSRPYYKDSDTKYVRLAKQGGRRDLLNYQEFDQHKEAVAYPKVDWFYLEDNALADAKKKKDPNWTFGVPEYMTQTSAHRQESGDQIDEPQKLEASQNAASGQTNVVPTNGLCTDKHLSNLTMPAGREQGQMHSKTTLTPPYMTTDCSQNSPLTNGLNYKSELVRGVAPEQQFKNPITQKESLNCSPAAGLVRNQGGQRYSSQVSMSKLLSHSYGKEWHEQLKDQQSSSRRLLSHVAQEIPQTENSQKHPLSRHTSAGDENNEEIHFTDNGCSLDESEISRTCASLDITDSVRANNAAGHQRSEAQKMAPWNK